MTRFNKQASFAALLLLTISSCISEIDQTASIATDASRNKTFYATIEGSEPDTKVFADANMKVLWNADDRLSVFNMSTYNYQFRFAGEDGDNAGGFDEIDPGGLISGNKLSYIYAVYPYSSTNKINNAGTTITLTLPAEQAYKEHSFGIGANTMIAVTDKNFLAFKNVGGCLSLRLYGDNVSVSRITLQGNNHEKIAGKADIAVGVETLPSVTMTNEATETISIVCAPAVQLGTSSSNYTDFWFVIPPVTFTSGFTVTVTDKLGGTFSVSTSSSFTISRSTVEWMSPLKVVPDYTTAKVSFEDANFKAYCVQNFDTNHDGEISMEEASEVTNIQVNTENIASLQGIEFFTNLIGLKCEPDYSVASGDLDDDDWHLYRDAHLEEEVIGLLTSLDLSNNTKLEKLQCKGNQLTTLVVSKNEALLYLNCNFNFLANLDVSHNPALTGLYSVYNPLTNLDVSKNTRLTTLECGGSSHLESIDLSKNTALTWLRCSNCSHLTDLNISKNTALTYLECEGNQQLAILDVSKNTSLTQLWCGLNQLSTLDVSKNTLLRTLECSFNPMTNLDVSKNTLLTHLYCRNMLLTDLDVSNNAALNRLRCQENPNLTSIWLKTGQSIDDFQYDTSVATVKYND